jgi:hypothetical protein
MQKNHAAKAARVSGAMSQRVGIVFDENGYVPRHNFGRRLLYRRPMIRRLFST